MRNGDSNPATFITCPPCMAYAEFLLAGTVTGTGTVTVTATGTVTVTVTGTVTVTVTVTVTGTVTATGTVTVTVTVTVLLGWLDIDVKTAHVCLPSRCCPSLPAYRG